MGELRVIDFSKKYFECQGRTFYIRPEPSFNRYRELQKLILEFSFSATFVDIFKNVHTAYDFLNGNSIRPADAAVTLHNIMVGVKALEDKDDAALRICALFMDEEGEDPTVCDEGKMREKIDCWAKELSVTPFFQFAANCVPYWMNAYKLVSQNGLKKEREKEEAPTQ